MAKASNCRGRHRIEKNIYLDGGHCREKKHIFGGEQGGWVVDDSFKKNFHFVAPSCKLELARFSGLPRIQDGNEFGNKTKIIMYLAIVFMEDYLGVS